MQASSSLVLNMKAPIQCQVDAHEAQTVQELLETLAVHRFELRKADAEKLTLEFGSEPMERHRTLVAIGMCDQAGFRVLGVGQVKARRVRRRLVQLSECAQVDLWEAAANGRLEEVQLVCDVSPERVNERDEPVRRPLPHAIRMPMLLLRGPLAASCWL